jgi:hypothetical protein
VYVDPSPALSALTTIDGHCEYHASLFALIFGFVLQGGT